MGGEGTITFAVGAAKVAKILDGIDMDKILGATNKAKNFDATYRDGQNLINNQFEC